MTFYLTGYDRRKWELPEALSWTLSYGTGTPCDSFEVRCPWGTAVDGALSDAVEFTAVEDGKVLFRGRVDEYELTWDMDGCALEVSGRGMAALLLDNEAESADYQVATLEDILRDHVEPYGIRVAEKGDFPAVPGFSVESGESEWQVLRSFVRYYGGVEPRFDRTGALVLSPWGAQRRLTLDSETAALAWRWREERYGALSEVLVRDRVRKTTQTVRDEEFYRRGGRCRRVVTMPGRSTGDAMRYSGAYQIAEAKKGRLALEVTVSGTFAAWPGEEVDLARDTPALTGAWRVARAESRMGMDGGSTRLTLERRED